MEKWLVTNEKGQMITVMAEAEEDLPVAFSIDGSEPIHVVRVVNIENLPDIDENTEEITVKRENLIDIPEGLEMTHTLDKPIKVNIV